MLCIRRNQRIGCSEPRVGAPLAYQARMRLLFERQASRAAIALGCGLVASALLVGCSSKADDEGGNEAGAGGTVPALNQGSSGTATSGASDSVGGARADGARSSGGAGAAGASDEPEGSGDAGASAESGVAGRPGHVVKPVCPG